MAFHKSRISFIVVPVMLVELITSILLSFSDAPLLLLQRMGLGIVVLIWLTTFFLQVPLHEKLSDGYNEEAVRKLGSSNWWRTFLWSAKSALGIYLLTQVIELY